MGVTNLEEVSHECKELLDSLPKERGWRTPHLYLFQGFWCQPKEIQAIVSVQTHFQAQDTDVMVATIPKSGTTWLKALVFAIVNRNHFRDQNNHPLLTHNPHDLVPFLEYKVYSNNQVPDLSALPSPRLFATHVPFASLPGSVKTSDCRIVYICRNPFDTFVSVWHFMSKTRPETLGPFSMEEAFDMYCKGIVGFGPYWDHMLDYWKQSLEKPHTVLFLKYEDMKDDTTFQLKRTAKFLGCPFSLEEERGGVIEDISRLCSFEKMKELEVNKSGKSISYFANEQLFRKGEVGDWVNYFTPLMVERLSNVMDEKLGGSGLAFKMFCEDKH
ncbi:cytosolic sulfotransferase 15-like [Cornus florida]|uniref:cytosolic sulfotransferase 15-like n=1 Tax=Cornus florida TaxID=4283 RepID=UPI00289AB5D7|nr:cytosolic sulfotransferase 15-like [Cornus florida]